MQEQFIDRILNCVDCHGEFIFTAGEQLFFFDKQFKNDPKRCKPCKSRRSGLSAVANGAGLVAAGLSRTETRTLCSDCGIETTVPFKPTQGRPVLCRQCFQLKARAPKVAATTGTAAADAVALAQASTTLEGSISTNAAVLAAASMSAAPAQSSVATSADLASISQLNGADAPIPSSAQRAVQMIAGSPVDALSSDIPTELLTAEVS
jgi:CxxC-x17-CxxC domain-containing protein